MANELLHLVSDELLTAAQVADTLGFSRELVLGAARDFEAGAVYDGHRRMPFFTVESAVALRNHLMIMEAVA